MKNCFFKGMVLTVLFVGNILIAQAKGILLADTSHGSRQEDSIAVPEFLNNLKHLSDNDVRFRTSDKTLIFIDPLSSPTDKLVIKSGMVVPDLILITHPHGDHFSPSILREYVNLNPNVTLAGPSDVVKMLSEKGIKATELKPNENYTIADVEFSTVPAYFKKREWNHHVEKEWLGYILQIDGESYYVTGDTESFPEMEDIQVDVIFPLLYGCGINMDLTLDMIEKTHAHFVIPVHHSNKVETINKLMDKIQEDVQCYYFLDQNLIKGQ